VAWLFSTALENSLEKEEIKVVVAPVLKLYRKCLSKKHFFVLKM
jgi:hypothetical protein